MTLPTEDEVRARIRAGLISLGVPPAVIVDTLMRRYFEQWAKSDGIKAGRWLDAEMVKMTGEPR